MPEHRVLTAGGNKGSRYVDVVGKDAQGNVVEMHQVGRQTRSGNPVSREVKALDDIQGATGVRPNYPRTTERGLMGKQISFYLTPADTFKLEFKLREIEPFHVLHSRSDAAKARVLDNLNYAEHGQQWLYFFLVRRDDVDSVVMRNVPSQGYWSVDVLKSPVIEFQRSFFDEYSLKRGRIYYVDKYYGVNNKLVKKSESFREWAQSIFLITRKSLIKYGPDFIGEESKAWLDSTGGTLVQ